MTDQNPKSSPDNSESPGGAQTERFLHLYGSNQKRIYAFILTLVSNWDDADDLMQATIGLMWQKFGEYELGTNFSAWGIRIARYKVMEYYRKQSRSRINFSNDVLEAVMSRAEQVNESADKRLLALNKCMSKLTQRDQELVGIRYAEGMTMKSLSQRVGRPVHGLYKAMGRIHNTLMLCVRKTVTAEERI